MDVGCRLRPGCLEQRFVLPKLQAMNFVLVGGVNDALNLDAHGKALSFLLLDLPIEVPDHLLHLLAGPSGLAK